MWQVQVETFWVSIPGNNFQAIALSYPGSWTDVTGQADENIPCEPNSYIVEGIIDDDTLTALYADTDFNVLSAIEIVDDVPQGRAIKGLKAAAQAKPAAKDGKDVPATAERNALRAKLQGKGYTAAALNRAVKSGDNRETMIEALKIEMRKFPRAKG